MLAESFNFFVLPLNAELPESLLFLCYSIASFPAVSWPSFLFRCFSISLSVQATLHSVTPNIKHISPRYDSKLSGYKGCVTKPRFWMACGVCSRILLIVLHHFFIFNINTWNICVRSNWWLQYIRTHRARVSSEADSRYTGQEIPRPLENFRVEEHVPRSTSLGSILNKIKNPYTLFINEGSIKLHFSVFPTLA
jgi:hypothetical protein